MVVLKIFSKPSSWALALVLAGSACGYDGDLPTTTEPPAPPIPPTQAGVALTLSPSPVDAIAAVDGVDPWSAEWTLIVQETSGIAGSIELVEASLSDSAGVVIAEIALDVDQLSEQLGGSTRIAAAGRQELPMSLGFDFPEDAVSTDLHITVQLRDDLGNSVSAATDDVVQVCVPVQLSPDEGAVLDNGCTNGENGILWQFDWSDCPDAQAYGFHLEQRNAEGPLVRPGLTDSSFSLLENAVIFEEARSGWFWKVRAKINGIWGEWSRERDFEVEPADTDCPGL